MMKTDGRTSWTSVQVQTYAILEICWGHSSQQQEASVKIDSILVKANNGEEKRIEDMNPNIEIMKAQNNKQMKTYFSYPSTYVFCFNLCLCWMYYEQKSTNVILKDNNITNKYFELTCLLLSELQKRNKKIHKLIEKMTQVCTKLAKKMSYVKKIQKFKF